MLVILISSFTISSLVSFLVIKYFHFLFHDPIRNGAQKFHTKPTPRAGGISIFINVLICGILKEVCNLIENQVEYQKMSKAINPYGDGFTSKRIVDIIKNV